MTVIDHELSLEEQCAAIWAATQANARKEQQLRQVPPLVRLFDGEMRLQHVVQAEYAVSAELIDGDTGPIEIRHPFDHPVGQWLWDEQGRIQRGEKRNVNITIEYCESRIAGLLEYVELEFDEKGDQVVVARFASDYERLKWYTVWANPWLPEWIQFPRLFIAAGPIPWLLALLLDLQLQRERNSTWAMPSDPMDPSQRTGLDQSTWSMVVKPISFMDAMASGALWGIAASRFKNFHDLAKPMYQDGEITPVIRCYLEGDPPPWPGANLRHGTRVVSFEDRSGRYTTGTATGGSIWDGLIRTISEFVGDFIDSTTSLATDTTIPVEYFEPGSKRTQKELPFAVWRDGEITGLETYRFRKTPSKGIQVITGGHSMPGVNELISATIQLIGDLTAMIPGVPPLGGVADAILRPFYEDTILAWMVARSAARANTQGWTRYFEYLAADGAKAYTISSLMVLRAGFWATRSYESHQFSARDGSPYLIGETGHVWLGDRGGYTIRGDKTGRIYIDRITKVQLSWDRENPPEWTLTFGDDRALEDPVQRAWERIEAIVSSLQQLGF
ncbi:hypothetical protein AAI421_14435 [Rhodococcus aetherivorans]|uniref:Gp37-like protein n=1 Tax=Rhodococcus aetherivorans TaxID=191292 RepID=UPI0031DFBF72